MRRFIWELAKFGGVQGVMLLSFVTVFFGVPERHHYLASAWDKAERLEASPSPRLILIGDSGVAYGMKSDVLAEAYPGFTVVNMALMAGLGFRNILAEIEDDLRPGDVVVMIFAYQVFDRNLLHYQYWNYAAYRPEMLRRINWRDVPVLMDNASFFVNRAMKTYKRVMTWEAHPDRPGPVNRAGFDAYGDLVAHHDDTTLPTLNYPMTDLRMEDPRYSREVVHELNAFAQRAEERGATVLYMFPPVPSASWRASGGKILEAAQWAKEGLEFPILNQPQEMIYADDEFYDTNYHMLEDGARRRTELLAERLRPYLQPAPATP